MQRKENKSLGLAKDVMFFGIGASIISESNLPSVQKNALTGVMATGLLAKSSKLLK